MTILAPSILAADMRNLEGQIRLAELGGADWIHCDVMDGHFVPNITFGPIIVKAARKCTRLPLDVHLMIEKPDRFLKDFAEAGASSILVHYEKSVHLNRTINRIKELKCKAGVVINPATPVRMLGDIAEYVDIVLIMSVNPGFGGQVFIPGTLKKIEEAVKLREEIKSDFVIEVDGGIELDNIRAILDAGSDSFVIGSSIFETENITATVTEFRNIISGRK